MNNDNSSSQIPSLFEYPKTLTRYNVINIRCSSQILFLQSPGRCSLVCRRFITNWYYSFLSSSAIYDAELSDKWI